MDKKTLLIKYHTVCSQKGISTDEKESMLESFGVESSKDLKAEQLVTLINKLQEEGATNNTEADKWRKRVIAAIGGWLRNNGISQNIELIKGIATRASGTKDFNRITISKLRAVYNEFCNKESIAKECKKVKQDIESYVALRN